MKLISAITLLLVASAATAQASELDDLDILADLQPLPSADIVPRLLRELGLGDAPAPGAYAQTASPSPAATPGAYGPAPTLQVTAVKPATATTQQPTTATPATPAGPAVIGQPTTVPGAVKPTAGKCPADTKKVNYTAGTLYCVLENPSAEQGEVYVTMDGTKGKVAVPTDNTCYVAPCIETIDALETTKSQTTIMGGMHRKLMAVQGAVVTPFVMQIEESTTTPVKLSNSKCFYVCESQKQGTLTVVRP